MRKKLGLDIICVLLIMLFVYTAVSKLLDLRSFELYLQLIPLLGGYSRLFAWVLPVTELLIAIALITPYSKLAGLYGSFLLMIIFTLYLAYLLLFHGGNLPCSCGGVLQQMGWTGHLVFNICFTILAGAGILLYHNNLNFFIAISRRSRKPV